MKRKNIGDFFIKVSGNNDQTNQTSLPIATKSVSQEINNILEDHTSQKNTLTEVSNSQGINNILEGNQEILNNVTVTIENCTTTSRCSLRRNSTMHIQIKFKPEFDVKDLITEVYGIALNIPIPLLGVDNKSVCNNLFEENGTKKKCPVLKGRTYVYKDEIYIIEAYPKFKVDIHWSLKDPISRNIVTCFEAPAKIID